MRLIAAFLVVMIHCWRYYGRDTLFPLTRIAVPIFFMITGFFLFDPAPSQVKARILKSLRRITAIWLVGTLLFAIHIYFKSKFKGDLSVFEPTAMTPIYWLICCHQKIGFPLWFLVAMAEGLLAMLVTSVWKRDRWFPGRSAWIIPCSLITLGVVLNKYVCPYYPLLGNYDLQYPPVLFASWPFLYLGYQMHKHQEPLVNRFQSQSRRLTGILILLAGLGIIEGRLASQAGDCYLTTLPQVLIIFTLLLLHPDFGGTRIATIGRRYSLWVYILHVMVYDWLYVLLGSHRYFVFHPVFIFLITLAIAPAVEWLMRRTVLRKVLCLTGMMALLASCSPKAPDPNFSIYLCFGQSNMLGADKPEAQDSIVSDRFVCMTSVDGADTEVGQWRPALPPLCQTWPHLSLADEFGHTLLEHLPATQRVGVIVVAVNGAAIRLFDKDQCQGYIDSIPERWMRREVEAFGDNPYERLVSLARKAQQEGVIRGILMHQGETDATNDVWFHTVSKVYHDLLTDLHLSADSVPLLAGEAVAGDQNGAYQHVNATIDRIHDFIPTAYPIPSCGCAPLPDHLHFAAAGTRRLGHRYGLEMLRLMGYQNLPQDSDAILQLQTPPVDDAFLVQTHLRQSDSLLLIASVLPLDSLVISSFSGKVLTDTCLHCAQTVEINLVPLLDERRLVLSFQSTDKKIVNRNITLPYAQGH